MNDYTLYAKKHIEEASCTLVYCNEKEVKTSGVRGVMPLFSLVQAKGSMSGFYCADKVVGKAAAFMYALLKPEELYAFVLSEKAETVLKKYGVKYYYGKLVPFIKNRKGDGFCPMEAATENAESPGEAFEILREKLSMK